MTAPDHPTEARTGGLIGDDRFGTHLGRALDASPDLVLLAVRGDEAIRCNRATDQVLGLGGGPVDLALLDQRAPAWVRQRFLDDAIPAVEASGSWEGELAVHDAEGDLVALSVVMVALRDTDGEIEVVAAVARDISGPIALEHQLEHRATHDALTSLPNRTLLLDRLEMALGRARRHATLVAVLSLDLDGFKPVNDTLGHAAGDVLLVQVARRIESAIRPGDTAARLGGDEFVVVCEDLTGGTEAVAVARRIADAVARPVRIQGTAVTVTASIGLATSDGDGVAPDLLREADAAMYRAKQSRRSR